MFSNLLTINSKMRIFKSLISSVVTCGYKTWVLRDVHEQQESAFGRKVMSKIHGSIKNQDRDLENNN
jgi:hypothetical protein